MDPNLSSNAGEATPHVVVPSPQNPPVPQPAQSAFSQMNSPQPAHHTGELPHQVPPDEKPGRKLNKKLAVGLIAVLVLVGLPLTVYMTQQQQTVQQQAAPTSTDDKVVAVFNGEDITLGQVKEVAAEQYEPTAIDKQALEDALNILLERKILDREKALRKIEVPEDEVQRKVEDGDYSATDSYYVVLRQKVTEVAVKNWKVYTIGFWQPATSDVAQLNSTEKSDNSQILSVGKTMINEARDRFENDESAYSIAKGLLSKYPNFKGVLAVNGYQISASSLETAEYENARVYVYETKAVGQPYYDTIYSLTTPGEVKLNLPTDGSGADAIKLVSTNSSNFNTYNNWLADQLGTVVINGL